MCSHLRLAEASQTPRGIYILSFSFFFFLIFIIIIIISIRYVLTVTACAHERFCVFLLTYARLRLAFSAHLCSI